MLDVVSVGDATRDTFLKIHEADLHVRSHPEVTEICFHYGEKIPVDELSHSLGGNAANVAVGLKNLGLKTAFLGILGDDEGGRWIYNSLKKRGVNVTSTVLRKGMRSNQSTIISFLKERTILTFHDETVGKLRSLPRTRSVYLTSYGHGGSEVFEKVISYQKKHPSVKIGFNPGTRDVRRGLEEMRAILRVATVMFVNREEAKRLTNIKELGDEDREKTREGLKEAFKRFHDLGVALPVITDGPSGSYAFDGSRFYYLPIFGSVEEIVERTGAGDAYASGFLAAFMKGKSVAEAMAWGSFNAASVVQKVGAVNGLLKIEEMRKRLRENEKYRGKEKGW